MGTNLQWDSMALRWDVMILWLVSCLAFIHKRDKKGDEVLAQQALSLAVRVVELTEEPTRRRFRGLSDDQASIRFAQDFFLMV